MIISILGKILLLFRFLFESSLMIITAVAAIEGSQGLAITGGALMFCYGLLHIISSIGKVLKKKRAFNDILQTYSSDISVIYKLYRNREIATILFRWGILYLLMGTLVFFLAVFDVNDCKTAGWVAVVAGLLDILANALIILTTKFASLDSINRLIDLSDVFEANRNPVEFKQAVNFYVSHFSNWKSKTFGEKLIAILKS